MKELNIDSRRIEPRTALYAYQQCQERAGGRRRNTTGLQWISGTKPLPGFTESTRASWLQPMPWISMTPSWRLCGCFAQYRQVLTFYQDRFRYILVDEYSG